VIVFPHQLTSTRAMQVAMKIANISATVSYVGSNIASVQTDVMRVDPDISTISSQFLLRIAFPLILPVIPDINPSVFRVNSHIPTVRPNIFGVGANVPAIGA
jgi:hypothetical protein